MTHAERVEVFKKHGLDYDYLMGLSHDELTEYFQIMAAKAWDEIFTQIEEYTHSKVIDGE